MARRKTTKRQPTIDPDRCGTHNGYAAHNRRGETACQACKDANAAYMREYKRKNRARLEQQNVQRREKKQQEKLDREKAAAEAAEKERAEREEAQAPADPPVRPVLDVVRPITEPDPGPPPPDWLKAKGQHLWESVTSQYELTPAALVLLGEACRTADRLERMAAALSSRSTLWFELGDVELPEDEGIPIVVNGMIGEARQLQTALRQTLGQLGVVSASSTENKGTSVLESLQARREKRRREQG